MGFDLGFDFGFKGGGGNKSKLQFVFPGFIVDGDSSIFSGGGQVVADADGILQGVNSDVPAIVGGRFVSAAEGFSPFDTEGSPLYNGCYVRTKNGVVWLADDADPTEFPRYLSEPARTNLFQAPGAPVTQGFPAGTYAVSVVGTGNAVIAGCTSGIATEGTPVIVGGE